MKRTKSIFPIRLLSCLMLAFLFSFCSPDGQVETAEIKNPIKKAEIIAFQKGYGVSFNGISEAISKNSYYESAAKAHIAKHYNFDEGKVMFKVGHQDDPYRYTESGVLSYLIGKNNAFPNDKGVANENWRKMEWSNDGIINDESGMAIVMGTVKMFKENNDSINQNYTMCLKRNSSGKLKLIAHKIATACN